MAAAPRTLKLLHKLSGNDTFFIEFAGLGNSLVHAQATLTFLHFYSSGHRVLLGATPLQITVRDAVHLEGRPAFVGTVPHNLQPGMYLLGSVTLHAQTVQGQAIAGQQGNQFKPMEPKLGFCVDHDICDVKLLEPYYHFVDIQMI